MIKKHKCKECGESNKKNFYGSNKQNCKKCHNKKLIKKRQKNLEIARELKGNKCCKCGYNKCKNALEFHHIDTTKKDFAIGGSRYGLKKLLEEVNKCILVCANCHREIHSKI